MPCTREASNFRHPDAVKLGVRRNAVIVVIGDLTVFVMFRVQAHVTPTVLEGILGIDPARSRPVTREGRTRREVDDIENRSRIINGIGTRVTHVFRRRIFHVHRIAGTTRIVVETVIEAIVELFHVADKRTVFVSFFVLVVLERKKLSAHTVLDIRNFAFHHVGHQVVALARLHGQALVGTELARISELGIRLLVQDGFGIEGLVLTNALARNKRTRAAQRLLSVGSQVLVMRKADIVATVRHVKLFEVRRIGKVSVEHVTFLVADFARESRTFKTGLVTFDNVTLDRCIPVIIRCVVEADIAHVVALLLVTAELGSQKTRLTSALQGSNNHRKHRHRHIGNIQHHRARGNGLLGLHHHAASVKVEVLVRRVVTGTKVTARNLNSLIRESTNLHTIQLLVVLIRGRIIDFADPAFHVVFEPHSRKRRILGLTQNRIATCSQDTVFLVEQDGVGIQGRRAVLELGAIVQVKG